MDDYKQISFALLAIGLTAYAVRWYTDPVSPLRPQVPSAELRIHPQLRAIPTVGGSSLPGLSWLAAFRMLGDCRDVLQEGYYMKARPP